MKKRTPQILSRTPEALPLTTSITRRAFFQAAGGAALLAAARARPHFALPGTLPNPVGYSNISWPANELNQAMENVSALGYQGMQFLGWVQEAYAGNKAAQLKDRLRSLRLSAAALSCSKIDLRPDSPETFTEQFREYATFVHALGGEVLQLTDSGKPHRNYRAAEIKSMGTRMNELGKMAKDSGMAVGYHPHFGTFGETREGLGRVMDCTDPRYVGLIADVAHLKLGGSDPAEVIRTYRQRLVLLHLKDVRRDAYELAQQRPVAPQALTMRFCEIGRGVVDFPAVVASLRESGFEGWAIVELDRFQPPPGGPAESARINKEALRALGFRFSSG